MSQSKRQGKGILRAIKSYLQRSKLGELLVMKGIITTNELREALHDQRETGKALGEIFVQKDMISRRALTMILGRQYMLRFCAAFLFLFVSVGGTGKRARADIVKDIPPSFSISMRADFAEVATRPALFGSVEKRSHNLKAFTKWTGMFDRFDASMRDSKNQKILADWKDDLESLQGRTIKHMAAEVNAMVNARKYIIDSKNWGQSDYWATPVEFLKYGGDCEDFAIAKYTALRALGVPEDNLRIAIVHDTVKDIPHAILVVYAEDGAYILDNQTNAMKNESDVERYRPIFSINREAWWLHTQTDPTVLASAN